MINYEAKMYRTGVYKRTITFRKSFFLNHTMIDFWLAFEDFESE